MRRSAVCATVVAVAAHRLLEPQQWERLMARLENPEVPTKPSRYSLKVKRERGGSGRGGAASPAHLGE